MMKNWKTYTAVPRARLRGICMALTGMLCLAACGKTLELREEVDIAGYTKPMVVVERRQFYEKRITQLKWVDVFVGADLRILDTNLPTWTGELHPTFLGYTKDTGFVLMTTIRDSSTCVRRGRPKSNYVAYAVSGRNWIEVQTPNEFNNLKTNLLLSPALNEAYSTQVPLSMKEKEFPNQIYSLHAGLDVVNLSEQFGSGC